MVPDSRFRRGHPVQFPLPTLFLLLFLKFDSNLGYRDFVAYAPISIYEYELISNLEKSFVVGFEITRTIIILHSINIFETVSVPHIYFFLVENY